MIPAPRLLGLLAALSAVSPSPLDSHGRVTIYRDDWGVPHIYADREEDGYYGLGYATAEDQLDYALRIFLSASGQAAAAFGREALEQDYASRLWRHAEEAQAGFARLSPELQRNYRAYVRGMERWMREHPDQVPTWASKLEPWDPVAVSRWMLWLAYQVGDGLGDCQAGGIQLSRLETQAVEQQSTLASNEWIIAPWRTADGALMMLSDPHGGVDGQFVFEFRMHAGRLSMAGYSVLAMPLLVQTRRVAWGMTTGAPDVSDCYEIELMANGQRRYRYDGKPMTIERRPVTIAVKGEAPVIRHAEYTRHNGVLSPVIARSGGKAYVVSTTYMHEAGVFDEEVYRMVLASNIAGVREAMRSLGMFPQNVMAGDADGNSWYVRAGRTPKRPAGYDWKRPVPGNTSRSAWLGIHPLDDLVQIESPATGYMQNNNIGPDQMFPGSPLTADRYPADIYNDTPGRTNSRGRRAVEVLSRAYRFTVEDAIELALDEKWIDTERWRAALARALARLPERAASAGIDFRSAADRLLRFDGQARSGSAGALTYWYWREALSAGPGGVPVEVLRPSFVSSDTISMGLAVRLVDAVDSAVATMKRLHGKIDLTLGEVFRIGRGGMSSWPVGGVGLLPRDLRQCEGELLTSWSEVCVMTLRAFIPGNPDSLGRRHATIGSRLLRLTVFTNPIQSFTIHNFGQSSRRDSPHYDDQAARLSSDRRVKPIYFEKSELLPHVKSERTLAIPTP